MDVKVIPVMSLFSMPTLISKGLKCSHYLPGLITMARFRSTVNTLAEFVIFVLQLVVNIGPCVFVCF